MILIYLEEGIKYVRLTLNYKQLHEAPPKFENFLLCWIRLASSVYKRQANGPLSRAK